MRLNVQSPAQVYPFFEMAAQHAWGLSPEQAQQESAELYAQYAAVAAENPYAWIQQAADARQIADVSKDNRLIDWPYPKSMVANPNVNQAAAVIVTSLSCAREAGIPEHRMVHLWGGAAAREPEDYLQRDRYDRSTAQSAVLKKVLDLVGNEVKQFAKMELYSCFPIVPKMALRELGLKSGDVSPSVTGGLSFFGGPLNNYMTHALCAMVRELRASPEQLGLLYGQGGYVNKHHALALSVRAPAQDMALDYSVQDAADAARDAIPEVLDHYTGPAQIETYSVHYARDGEPLYGNVILRTSKGERTMARVAADDEASMQVLLSRQHNAIGTPGHVRIDVFGLPIWEAGEQARDRSTLPRKFCTVERKGHLTVVTIARPESMNALHPAANAELAEIFDDFAADPEQWVAILTGTGDRAFCSGNDLKFTAIAMARGQDFGPPLSGYAGLTSRFDLDKPVIAAVNGVAFGAVWKLPWPAT